MCGDLEDLTGRTPLLIDLYVEFDHDESQAQSPGPYFFQLAVLELMRKQFFSLSNGSNSCP